MVTQEALAFHADETTNNQEAALLCQLSHEMQAKVPIRVPVLFSLISQGLVMPCPTTPSMPLGAAAQGRSSLEQAGDTGLEQSLVQGWL